MPTHWALRLIHFLYAAFVTIAAWLRRRNQRQPRSLNTRRKKIPKHLCLNLVVDDDMPVEDAECALLQCLQSVASWCRVLGVETLTVYDRNGTLYRCSESAYRRVFVTEETSEDSCESEVEYPLTPPLSEPSVSRSHSPEHTTRPVDLNIIAMVHVSGFRKRRNVAVRKSRGKGSHPTPDKLRLYIVSRASGKPAIVSASRSLLQTCVSGATMSGDTMPCKLSYSLTGSQLAMILEAGLPPPDLMVIHHIGCMKMPYPPIELYGFPPWQNSLTEFHRTHPDDGPPQPETSGVLISEAAFCRALDEYAGAEFRLGR